MFFHEEPCLEKNDGVEPSLWHTDVVLGMDARLLSFAQD
jgi:hypothetical protein